MKTSHTITTIIILKPLSTDEVLGNILVAHIEEQAEREWNIKVNPQNVSPNRGAKADRSLKVDQPLDEAAAWRCRRRPNCYVEKAA